MDGRRRLAFPNKKFLFGKRKVVASGPFIDTESGSLPRHERIGTNSGRVGARVPVNDAEFRVTWQAFSGWRIISRRRRQLAECPACDSRELSSDACRRGRQSERRVASHPGT